MFNQTIWSGTPAKGEWVGFLLSSEHLTEKHLIGICIVREEFEDPRAPFDTLGDGDLRHGDSRWGHNQPAFT